MLHQTKLFKKKAAGFFGRPQPLHQLNSPPTCVVLDRQSETSRKTRRSWLQMFAFGKAEVDGWVGG